MDLGEMAFNLIKNYGNKTGTPPQRILFYRDGVADSQFDQVCRDEISALKGCFSKLKKGYNPQVVYIICGKRHHIRKAILVFLIVFLSMTDALRDSAQVCTLTALVMPIDHRIVELARLSTTMYAIPSMQTST